MTGSPSKSSSKSTPSSSPTKRSSSATTEPDPHPPPSWSSAIKAAFVPAVIFLIALLPTADIPSVMPPTPGGGGGALKKGADDSLAFGVTWFDPTMEQNRKFTLTFFPGDNSIEMYDLKLKRIFLSRIHCNTVDTSDLYLGNTVIAFSRRLLIDEYANEQTRLRVEMNHEATFAMVKPDAVPNSLGTVLAMIEDAGFSVVRARMTRLNVAQAKSFYAEHEGRKFFEDLVAYMTSGPVVAMELRSRDAVRAWRRLLGPTDPLAARTDAPNSVRARVGRDKTQNAAHGSDSKEAAERELEFFFPKERTPKSPEMPPKTIASFENSTCCMVKPHAVKAGQIGAVIEALQTAGFNVTGLQMFHLKYENAEEFFEIYKGVVQDYTGMVRQLASGPCVAMEVSHGTEPAASVQRLRDLVGPADPDLARTVRPHSLRARLGKNKDENAVHCTDLPEDGPLEVEYFFKILQP